MSGDGYVRDTVGKFEVGGGGSYFLEGGSRKGVSDEPPEPPPLVTGLLGNVSVVGESQSEGDID